MSITPAGGGPVLFHSADLCISITLLFFTLNDLKPSRKADWTGAEHMLCGSKVGLNAVDNRHAFLNVRDGTLTSSRRRYDMMIDCMKSTQHLKRSREHPKTKQNQFVRYQRM